MNDQEQIAYWKHRAEESEAKLKKISQLEKHKASSEFVLVELKTLKGRLRPAQIRTIKRLRDHGVTVYVLDNVEDFVLMLEKHKS